MSEEWERAVSEDYPWPKAFDYRKPDTSTQRAGLNAFQSVARGNRPAAANMAAANIANAPVPASYQRGVHTRRPVTAWFLAGYGAAAVTLLTAVVLAALMRTGSGMLVIPVAVVAVGAMALAAWLGRKPNGVTRRPRSSGLGKNLLAQLTPVVCLSVAFPLVGGRLTTPRIGSVSEEALLIAGALATPWLSQVVCTPLFAALSAAPEPGEPTSLGSRWLSRWPFVAVSAMPVAAAFGAGIGLALGWDRTAIGALMLLCMINSLFSQSMIVGILQRNYLPWAAAWFVYALVLVTLPRWWFLPPVTGLLTQLVYLVSARPALLRPVRTRGLLAQFAKGLLVGAVLWSDKLFFFLKTSQHFRAQYVFLAVLPAMITYGYYFVRLAPCLDQIVADMRATMESEALENSGRLLRGLADEVEESIVKVACVGSVLCLLSVIAVSLIVPSVSMLYAVEAVASVSFLVITVLLYMLDYIGRSDLVYKIAGVQLAVSASTILIGPPGPMTYIVLAVLSAGVTVVAARSTLTAWRLPEYSLFWRYATEW